MKPPRARFQSQASNISIRQCRMLEHTHFVRPGSGHLCVQPRSGYLGVQSGFGHMCVQPGSGHLCVQPGFGHEKTEG